MKTTNQILIVLAVMSLMACKNQMHVVTLYVDTTNIEQGNIATNANFGQPTGISNEDFTTHVRKGDLIIWQGQSISNPDHIVKITSIEHEEGKRIIERKPFKAIKSKDGLVNIKGSDELVRAKVTLGPGREEAYIKEKYILKFTVSNKDDTFTIDPGVQGHKKR
ncbi:MAG: hypothetical protein WBM91_16495 [Eudoraea sp.]|uniref:hypothetical protein n=1 Tax=Eudoraea sp. TaxID=1979955 RepID=UPI003C759D8D